MMEPRRLHPLTLLLRFAGLLPQFVPAAFGLSIAFGSGGTRYVGLIVLIGIGAAMLFAWIGWSRFTYDAGTHEIRIQSGVISRNNRAIPYARIADATVEQKLLARLLGLAQVRFETGSAGDGDEAVLNAVSLEEAERLRTHIRQHKAGLAEDAATEPVAEKAPLFAMTPRRILIAGFFNFSLVIFAVLGALYQNIDFLLPPDIFDPRYWIKRTHLGEYVQTYDWTARGIALLLALVALAGIGIITGIIRTFVREYGFRLDLGDTALRRRRGLLTLTDVAMPLHRVQAAVILTGPVRRRFGWFHLKFQSLASDGAKESDHSIAPCANDAEIASILAVASIHQDSGALHAVHRSYFWLPLLLILPWPVIGICISAYFVNPALLGLLALLPLPVLIGFLRWRRHGYALNDNQLFVREGFWRQRLTILPLAKVQSVDVSDNLLSRRFGHASMTLGVAGGSGILPLTVHAVERAVALDLRRRVLRQ